MINADLPSFLLNAKVSLWFSGLMAGNIVVVTGKEDVISDGEHTIIVRNGNALLGKITGVRSHCKCPDISLAAPLDLCWVLAWLWNGLRSCLQL